MLEKLPILMIVGVVVTVSVAAVIVAMKKKKSIKANQR